MGEVKKDDSLGVRGGDNIKFSDGSSIKEVWYEDGYFIVNFFGPNGEDCGYYAVDYAGCEYSDIRNNAPSCMATEVLRACALDNEDYYLVVEEYL